MNVKGQFVLRVSSVEQGGPAQRSGLEPGDIVIGANDAALGGLEQLAQLAQQGALKNLLVLDVNTGKTVRVPIEMAAASGPPADESNLPRRSTIAPGVRRRPPRIATRLPPGHFEVAGNFGGAGDGRQAHGHEGDPRRAR